MNKTLSRKAQKIIKILAPVKTVDVRIEERFARVVGRMDAKGTADIGVYMHLTKLASGKETILYSINGSGATESFRKLCKATKVALETLKATANFEQGEEA